MISPRSLFCFNFLHFERRSATVIAELSSTKIGASAITSVLSMILSHSSSTSCPVWIFWEFTRESRAIIRVTSCSFDISRLKIATGILFFTATWCAILSTNAVLPIAGRAATRINSDPCRPVSILSRSMNPVGTPVTRVFCLDAASI